jgi:uncharacterized protein
MYFPDTTRVIPEAVGLVGASEVALAASDGTTLVAWYKPPREECRSLLYFQGNGGNLAGRVDRFKALTADGDGLLALSYRGYGGSAGTPTEDGLLRDGEAAYEALVSRAGTPERIVVIGESLGTGIAVAVAAKHKVAALVLEAPYSATVDVAAARYWMFPVRLLMRDQMRSDKRIADVHCPILMLHGEADGVIPIRFGEGLFSLANEPKQFIRVPGAGHQVMHVPGVMEKIEAWLAAVP